MQTTPTTARPRAAYSISETADLRGVCRSTVYALMRSGRLSTVRVGSRVLIPIGAIERFLGKTAS